MSTEQSDPLGESPRRRVLSYLIGVSSVTVLTIAVVIVATAPVLDQLRNTDPQRFSFAVMSIYGIGIWFGTSWASGSSGEMPDEEEDSDESVWESIQFAFGLILVLYTFVIISSAVGAAVVGFAPPVLAMLVAFVWPMWESFTISRDGWAIPFSLLGASAFFFQILDRISEWGGRLADAIASYSFAPEHLFWSIRRRTNYR